MRRLPQGLLHGTGVDHRLPGSFVNSRLSDAAARFFGSSHMNRVAALQRGDSELARAQQLRPSR